MINQINKKKPALLLTLGTAAALVAGGGVAYWLSQRDGGPGALPVGAEVIPQDALMAVSVATDQGQWEQLRQFGTPQSQSAFDQSLSQLRDRVLTANGFNYDKDIKPWVGREVTVAFLAPAPAANTPTPPPTQQATVVVLPIQDPLKAKQLLEQPRSQTAGKLSNRTYKGFQIQETQNAAQNFSATVLDGKFLVVTTDPKATDRAIDTYKGGSALAATPGYTQALSKIQTAQPFGKVYVNLPAAAALSSANSGRPVSPQSLAQVQQIQGLAATVSLESEGMRFKSISWLKPDSQRKYEVQNNARTLPGRLPADTLMMASGGNLKRFWQDYSQGAAANPVSPVNPEALRNGLKSTIGLDLDKDLMTWMEGEFSLALVSAPEGSSPNVPFSLLLLVQSNDRRAAENTLKQIDQTMTSKYKFKVEEAKVGNQTVTNWVFPVGGPSITRGWLDGDIAFLSMGAPIANSFVPKPSPSLADSEVFKKNVPTDLQPNNGHFFFNVDRALNAKNLPLFQLPSGTREIFAAIRAIGVTAAISDERSTRYDVFVGLQKGNKPAPLPSPTVPAASTPVSPTPLPSAVPSPSPSL